MATDIEIKSIMLKLKSSKRDANIGGLEKVLSLSEEDPTCVKALMPAIIECLKRNDDVVREKALEVVGRVGASAPNVVKFAIPQVIKIALESGEPTSINALDALNNIASQSPQLLQRIGAKVLMRSSMSQGYREKAKALFRALYGATEIAERLDDIFASDAGVRKTIVNALQKGDYGAVLAALSGGDRVEAAVEGAAEVTEAEVEGTPTILNEAQVQEAEAETGAGVGYEATASPEPEEDVPIDLGEKGISEDAFEKMAEMLLQKAREAYEKGDYEAVEKYTQRIEELAQKSKVNIYIKEVEEMISSAESAIEWARNIGADVRKAETMLKKAKKAFQDEYYEGAMTIAKQAIELAEVAKNSFRRASPRVESVGPTAGKGYPGLSTAFGTSQNLLPEYTFDRFVVGNSNRFAHAAAVAVAEKPGQTYNPLFIYSGVGLGKTHLLQAIGNYIVTKIPHLKVMYVTTEKFTHDLMEALEAGALEVFREKYREVDVLLIDDIQFLSGQESTQEEFYNTFNALYNARKQIVLTSDRPPSEIAKLEKRLLTRFEQGLITDIQSPSLETRMIILKRTADEEGVTVPEDVVAYIAKQIPTNIRTLKGAIKQTLAYSTLTGREITVDLAKEVLKSMGEEGPVSEQAPEGEKGRLTRPEVEEDVVVMEPLELEPGHSYLIEETRPRYVFEVLTEKIKEGYRAMCITRTNPKQLKKKYDLENAQLYWLTDRRVEGAETIRPSLERMITTLENFMQEEGPGILVLDGVEYLVSLSRFDPVLKFLRELIDVGSLTETIFVVPLNPSAISPQEISMLERELETIKL